MSKEYERIREQVSGKYKGLIKELETKNKLLQVENIELKEKLLSLESELVSKTEWIERMQEFCNMTDEDRKNLIDNEKIKTKTYETLHMLASGFGRSGVFNYLKDYM